MISNKPRDDLFKAKAKRLLSTVTTFLMFNAALFAGNKEKQDSDSKERASVITETTVSFSNFSALNVQKDGCFFYNDFVPSVNASVEKNGFKGSFAASELVILNNGNWATINNKCLVELSKQLGDDKGELLLILGKEATEVGAMFFGGSPVPNMWLENTGVALFGNGAERLSLKYRKGDKLVELGLIGNNGEGFYVIPNPKEADLWAKVSGNIVKNDDFQLKLTAAGRVGNTDKVMGNVTAKTKNLGVSLGGNYDINNNEIAAFANIAYTTSRDVQMILNACMANENLGFVFSVGKNGVQAFSEINIPKNAPKTASLGVSYSFGKTKTL